MIDPSPALLAILFFGGLICVALGAIGLARLHIATAKHPAAADDVGIAIVSVVVMVAGLLAASVYPFRLLFSSLASYSDSPLWWLRPALSGAYIAAIVYVSSVFIYDLCGMVRLWMTRQLHTADQTVGFWLRRHGLVASAFMFLGALCLVLLEWLDAQSDTTFFLIPPTVVVIMQLFQLWLLPWILHRNARTLDEARFGEVHRWLETLAKTRRIPPFSIRVQEGHMMNALVTGGVRRHFIVVGRGLLDALSVDDVKAILAHEIGHVLNRDTTRRLLPLVGVVFVLHALYYGAIVGTWGVNMVTVFVGCFGIAVFSQIPGLVQRRWEFEADRRAVELIGDPEKVAQALERFCEVNGTDLSQQYLTHPSMRARLQAIGQLGASAPA